jgi:adenine-specific DNA-methyltransferase
MKYMGSKRGMLTNGLGELLRAESGRRRRVVDLFCGASSVSWFASQDLRKPVLAADLQHYAVILARAVIERTAAVADEHIAKPWFTAIDESRTSSNAWKCASELGRSKPNAATWTKRAREICGEPTKTCGPIWRSYGGYYYSPTQALTFDAMIASLPLDTNLRTICLAATIVAASKCAASPGHTAQPFRPTRTAGKFLREAWLRDPLSYAKTSLLDLCSRHAVKRGEAKVADACELASQLREDDLVFVDPPYSGVHYSRFYHVLETIARGSCGTVEGAGRYPPSSERPASSFSRKGEARGALETLLQRLGKNGCTVVLTFPAGECSNGLSGNFVTETACRWFKLEKKTVKTRFSTLGGNNSHRKARMLSDELILLLKPK